jgi:hypothetical protein
MNPIKMPEEINHQRRRFLSNSAMAIAVSQFGMLRFAKAEATNETAAQLVRVF